MKCYQAVRIAEEVQILHERATQLRSTYIAYLAQQKHRTNISCVLQWQY
jgi:hypothetical protein